MDNVTHTLAGLLVAEAVILARKRRGPLEPGFPLGAYWVSAISNNLPDLDFVYAGLTGGKLGYLLHHRGHTHTLAFVPVGAALVLLGVGLWRRRTADILGPVALRWLAALAIFGPLLHLALDLTNNYGVHPFWPLSNRWLYGDGVFIIEPYLLMCGVAGLMFNARRSWARLIVSLIGAATLAAVWLSGLVPSAAAAIFSMAAVILLVAAHRISPGRRVALAGIAWATVTGAFFASGAAARDTLDSARPRERTSDVLDVVMTPLPATPWCWAALSIELRDAEYRVVRATVAPFPSIVDAAYCRQIAFGAATAPRSALGEPDTPRVVFHDAFTGGADDLRALYRNECRARAFLRFARAPFWTDGIVGDLRYDRSPDLGFAELDLDDGTCPRFVPPWLPPRMDVLEGRPLPP